jgi:hypothetical protein
MTHQKLPSIKSLKNKAEKLWKEVCILRDGRQCMVAKQFPDIRTTHDQIFQVDHCIARGNKHFFLDPRNGTVVCKNCNGSKKWDGKSVKRAIDQIVIKREGRRVYNHMVKVDMQKSANENFSRRWWLEAQISKLEEMKQLHNQGERYDIADAQ